jgi:hypothetical protein
VGTANNFAVYPNPRLLVSRIALTSFNASTLALSEQLKALAAAFGTKGETRICLTEASKVGRTDSSSRRQQSNRASVSERLGDEQYHRQTITYNHQRRKTLPKDDPQDEDSNATTLPVTINASAVTVGCAFEFRVS